MGGESGKSGAIPGGGGGSVEGNDGIESVSREGVCSRKRRSDCFTSWDFTRAVGRCVSVCARACLGMSASAYATVSVRAGACVCLSVCVCVCVCSSLNRSVGECSTHTMCACLVCLW